MGGQSENKCWPDMRGLPTPTYSNFTQADRGFLLSFLKQSCLGLNEVERPTGTVDEGAFWGAFLPDQVVKVGTL